MSNCRPSNLLGEVILPIVHATDIHLSESALAMLMKPYVTMRSCCNDVRVRAGWSGVLEMRCERGGWHDRFAIELTSFVTCSVPYALLS
jgi:hypothetical protein